MVRSLLWFEITNRLRQLSSLIYFATFFSLSFFLAIMIGGAFKGINFSFGFSEKIALNSPVIINGLISSLCYYGLLIIAPIFGQSIVKDFETGFHQVLFATPIRKSTYFFVRFFGSFLSTLTLFSSIGLGIWAATFMPFIDPTRVIENRLWFYIAPYLSTLLPNLLTFGALFIAVASLSKKMAHVYVASTVLFTGYMISQGLTPDLDNKLAAALLEPFGMEATRQITRHWSITEQNTQVVPLIGSFLYNRLLWSSLGLITLLCAYLRFNPFALPKERKKLRSQSEQKLTEFKALSPKLTPRSWKVFFQLSLSEFKQIIKKPIFLILISCEIGYIFMVSTHIGKIYGTEIIPVTYHVLEILGSIFSLFVLIITSFYAGELIWKDRELKVYELVDSKPISDLYLYLSKFLSIILTQLFLIVMIVVSCTLIQISQGYTHFEWSIYAKYLLFYTLPSWIFTAIIAFFAHILSNSKSIAHTIVISFFVLTTFLPSFGLNHNLYLIGSLPSATYSDMNRFGPILLPYTAFTLYWAVFHIPLVILSILLWKRGEILTRKGRFAELRTRTKPTHKILLSANFCLWILLGSWIFYNTNILNTYQTKNGQIQEAVEYEQKYKQYEKSPQPTLTAVAVELDLFPETLTLNGKGQFKYQNTTSTPIQEIFLNVREKSQTTQLQWSKPAQLVQYDQKQGVQIYRFDPPIQPNEEVQLDIALHHQSQGFKNSGFSQKIVENGTFFYGTDFFPVIGYGSDYEVAQESIRKKHNLPEKPRMPNINDPEAIQKTCISNEGTWINFEATISTSSDQTAIAPGTLIKEWQQDNRRYFHYKADRPILPFYAILSGRYAVARDNWNDVQIEIFHHPSHTTNIDRMINSIKKSLDYYTQNFSPYQFKNLRIIEFPRYQSFAQSFPNTIPYSEGVGFIAKVNPNNPDDIDYPFYITAHEVAHQWWAHQVIGGKVQGATMLSESLAQYSALMVMEKEYGPTHMKKFLKYELDQYLAGRCTECQKELPLMLNEGQNYIHYQKGSLVFYALKDYLGEATVNSVLSDYIKEVAFQQPPFTKATDLVRRFKAIAPPDLKYLIEDLFETITFYDNRTEKVAFKKKPNGKYEVEICSLNKKTRANEQGSESEIPMNDPIDIGIFDKQGNLQYLQKHTLHTGHNKLLVEVDFEPSKAGLDPLNKLIDKITTDKIMKVIAEMDSE